MESQQSLSRLDVFPAYAGMSLVVIGRPSSKTGFPRLRGDEPILRVLEGKAEMFSPPTRG